MAVMLSSISPSNVFLSLHPPPLCARFTDLPWWGRPGDDRSPKNLLSSEVLIAPLFSIPQGQPASRAGHQGHRGAAALQRDHSQQHAEERQTQPRPEVRSTGTFSKLLWVGECGWREGDTGDRS